jgi:hypothetical protein
MILITDFSFGSCHDFKLFKNSKIKLSVKSEMYVDSGYQGIQDFIEQANLPIKKKKNSSLSKEEKQYNKEMSSTRVAVEHVIGKIKFFKIVSERYRNRRARFGLRFNLIAAIVNMNQTVADRL